MYNISGWNETAWKASNNRYSIWPGVEILTVERYLVPCIVCLGMLTSTLSCAVLLRTHLRKKFYSHFLVGESVSCLGFLATVLVNWMHDQGLAVFRVPGLCQVNVFCSHFFLCLVIWLTMTSALLILFDLTRSSPVRWMNSPSVSKVWVLGQYTAQNLGVSHFFLCLVIWLTMTSALLILFDLTRSSPVRWMNSPSVSKVWVLE
ncbi:hypothetical protein EGW08_015199 [Elysia chlorotica]|uniref:G-protein coupled receptors family 1 profile domain-containing protein n=1 Tax=Elysia chlorotica TaxID=188477 RepID=A0A433T6G6_ELYCH|nr:hypothetical protein EGW08_015199 [Elysia chlorotica]